MSTQDLIAKWTVQVRKGLLEFCILNALQGAKLYGYDIVKTLRTVDSLVIGEGTVYPILSRFRSQGLVDVTLVESPEGPARKYYELTSKGQATLAEMNSAWERIQHGIEGLRRSANR
jgi:PadR family transcriptional regulator PadR